MSTRGEVTDVTVTFSLPTSAGAVSRQITLPMLRRYMRADRYAELLDDLVTACADVSVRLAGGECHVPEQRATDE